MSSPLTDLLSNALGEPGVAEQLTLRPPLDHQSNVLYELPLAGQRLMVKVFQKQDEFTEAPVREFNALEALESLDLAPKPVFFHPGDTSYPQPVVV